MHGGAKRSNIMMVTDSGGESYVGNRLEDERNGIWEIQPAVHVYATSDFSPVYDTPIVFRKMQFVNPTSVRWVADDFAESYKKYIEGVVCK